MLCWPYAFHQRRSNCAAHESRADHAVTRAELFLPVGPDLLLGMDADPAQRNIFGVLAAASCSMARDGIRLRSIGQQIIEMLGGKRIHPAWVVPGGVSEPLSAEKRDQMLACCQKHEKSPCGL